MDKEGKSAKKKVVKAWTCPAYDTSTMPNTTFYVRNVDSET